MSQTVTTHSNWESWANKINTGMDKISSSLTHLSLQDDFLTWIHKMNAYIEAVNKKKNKSLPLINLEEDLQIIRDKINQAISSSI